MAADPRFDCVLADPVSGESLGLILDEPLQWQSTQPMAARITETKDWRSFDEWSVIEQSSWHHGRGLEIWDATDPERFYDSEGVETRIRDQITLAPDVAITGTQDEYPYRPPAGSGWSLPLEASGTGPINIKLAQSFQVGAPGRIITGAVLRLKIGATTATGTLSLRVETDNAGSPSGTLADPDASGTAQLSGLSADVFREIRIPFAANVSLSPTTTYWLVLTHNGAGSVVSWGGTTGASGYANGKAKSYKTAIGWWSNTGDFFFTFLDTLQGDIDAFAEYDGKWYCSSYTSPGYAAVYQWNNTGQYWVRLKNDFNSSIPSMVSFADKLWCGQSSTGEHAWTYDGTTWTETSVGGKFFLVWRGYLYRVDLAGNVYYTADGTTWSSNPWKVGNNTRGEYPSGIAGHGYDVLVGTGYGVYTLGPESAQGDLVDQLLDLSSQANFYNANLLTWARDGRAYIPVLGGLLSYQDGMLDSVGPDRDAGLPPARQGRVRQLLSLSNWLLAAVCGDAGDSIGSVLVYNGTGWHELVRSWMPGKAVRAIGYDTTSTTGYRLWFGVGTTPCYMILPDVSDNPYLYTGSYYVSGGNVISPWISMDMLSVEKDFQEFGIQCQMPSAGKIRVYYEVDHYGSWTELFTATAQDTSGLYTGSFPFQNAFVHHPIVAAGSTAKVINLDSTIELLAGVWVRINDEVRQVASVLANGVILVRPLSAAPAAGTVVYPARPSGVEIRFKIELLTTNNRQTPKLQAWWLKCMPMISDKLGAALRTSVYEGQLDYAGSPVTPDAPSRAALLHSFARRPTPIDVTDLGGTTRRVKITSISELQQSYSEGAMGQPREPRRTFSLSLTEV